MDRREFLKVMGVATGASALAGCNLERNSEKLIPYLVPPDDGTIVGDAVFKASTCTECPAGCAVSARIRDDRPVKVEGLAGHPVNDGALCVRGQSSLNRLYHTERIRQPMLRDGNGKLAPATWNQALASVKSAVERNAGEHLFLSGHTSGSYSALMDDFCGRLRVRRLPEFEWFSNAAIRRANADLFGVAAVPAYDLTDADFLLTVGADVLETWGNPVAFSRQLSARIDEGHFAWYHAEPHATMTGFKAAHRMTVRPGSEGTLLAFLLRDLFSRRVFTDRRLEEHMALVPASSADDAAAATGLGKERVEELAAALAGSRRPLVIAGGVATAQPGGVDVARFAALLQTGYGMVGKTVSFERAQDQSRMGSMKDVAALVDTLGAGRVGTLFIGGTDPAGTLPASYGFTKALENADFVVGIADTMTATMLRCDVVLPLSHALESWGDVEPRAGIVNVLQPTLTPLFDTRSNGDVLLSILAETGKPVAASYQEYLFARWNRVHGAAEAQALVTRGYIEKRGGDAAPGLKAPAGRARYATGSVASGEVLVVAASVRWYDGRSAELPLLREIPDPLTTVSWEHWVSVPRDWARTKGVKDRDEIELTAGGWKTLLPARVQPGLPDGVFVVHKNSDTPALGHDEVSGEANAYTVVSVRVSGAKLALPILSGSLYQEGRGAVPGQPPAHFGHSVGEHGEEHHARKDQTFNPEPKYPDYRWAMAIDMDKCTGCSACVAACYIENNVPMTGPEEHKKGREMSWIRLEPYYEEHGDGADFVPAMCQHCDAAPCEPVCPVYATYTNQEGLNAQVYNRCVGTRYCANNCPYKQRRFNWFPHNNRPEPLNLMVNPDVSLRGKGIMEKCSMCVQRIRKARDVAKDEKRKIQEGDLTTACAQSCPGNAIVFGNLLDENSRVHKQAKSERSHRLLEEIGTGPAVYYLTSKGNHHGA